MGWVTSWSCSSRRSAQRVAGLVGVGDLAENESSATAFLWGSWAGRLIVTVPINVPKLLQLYEFNVTVGEAQVDAPRKFLTQRHPARSRRGRNASMPGKGAAANRAGVGPDAQ